MKKDMRTIILPKQHGAALVEYLIVSAMMISALLLPLPSSIDPKERSAAAYVYDSLGENYRRFLWALSIPI